ncbi:radical SAM protein [archaeon SCG-AAA382B04]|nr:radical SAM protein [archaeon SCG-AAA382B04]
MKVTQKKCKSILSSSGIYGVDYSINPYTGCQHNCKYCYATYMKKFTDHTEPWGEFVEVKQNAPQRLQKDLHKKKSGNKILFSSVTDPYQPLEEEYEITKRLLEKLENTFFEINILTKGDVIERDLSLLEEFEDGISVGFTINFSSERDRKIWEPNASQIEDRIRILKELNKRDINSYIHIGPYLEGITDLDKIKQRTEHLVDEIQIENLNLRNQEKILDTIKKHYPDLEEKYRDILEDDGRYRHKLKTKTKKLASQIDEDTQISLFLD